MFEQFLKERRYLSNVSPRTIEWHEQSLKWLGTETPAPGDLKAVVIRMREAGLKPSSVNCRLRSINAFLNWSGQGARIPKIKEDKRVMPTFRLEDIKKFITARSMTFYQYRLQVLILTLFDCGLRVSEALTLKWADIDFDDLLLLVHGKGGKDRRVPFSAELRRRLIGFQKQNRHALVFATRDGGRLNRNNVLRDVKLMCARLGVTVPARAVHACRHTFGANYIRRGGDVFRLQQALGHSSLEMSRRYAAMNTEDLSAIHPRVSLLAA